MSQAIDIPHACTLPTADRPVRLAKFARLFATATSTTRHEATHLTVVFDELEGLASKVSDLAARESGCCSFFDFSVTSTGGQVVLAIKVDGARADILDALRTLGGHRSYDDDDAVALIGVIKAAQRRGFTLDEVSKLLEAGGTPDAAVARARD